MALRSVDGVMSGERAKLADVWHTFFRERCADDLRTLAEEYPRDRSLRVDILDLYGFDESFTQRLFDDPDRVIEAGRQSLRDLHEPFDRVNVRLTNHPGLLGLDSLRTRHVSELVSVEAGVAAVGPVESAVTVAVFTCPRCGATTRRRPRDRIVTPRYCEECGDAGALELDLGRSALVDVQQLTLEPLRDETDTTGDARLDAVVDDDLVGTVAPGEQLLLTGVLRLDGQPPVNRFEFYLDANEVSQEPIEARPPVADVSSELRDAIESRWELLGNQ